METFLSAILLWAANFAPRGWAFCQGQILSIAQNSALFSLLGTTFGGNGTTTFALPNFASRVPVGVGQGPGLSPYVLGQASGVESVTLITTQMPQHTHIAFVAAGSGASSATGTLKAINGPGGSDLPGGNYLAQDTAAGSTVYGSAGTPVNMNAGAVAISNITVPLPAVTNGMAGGSQPHDNIQPYLAINYIIALEGIYPSRN